jgi:cell division septum initiation protein DivIVA
MDSTVGVEEVEALQRELDDLRARTSSMWQEIERRGADARRVLDEEAHQSRLALEAMERNMLMEEHAIRERAHAEADRILADARREADAVRSALHDQWRKR